MKNIVRQMKILNVYKIPRFILSLLKMKLCGVTYGRNLRGDRVVIKNVGHIIIGHDVRLNSFPGGDPYRTGLQTHCKDAKISIGDKCILNGTMIHCRTSVTIGSYCMFGPGTKIVDNDSHRVSIDIAERGNPPNSSPIVIEDNVWVGMNSLILKGVKIGRNSIIGAHSVITKDVPINVLVAGNPAKIVKKIEGG